MINIYTDMAALLPVKTYQQGSAPQDLPTSFYTVWNNVADENAAADNDSQLIEYEWTVIYYTKRYSTIYTGIENLKTALTARGYIVKGNGYDFGGAYEEWQARAITVKRIATN